MQISTSSILTSQQQSPRVASRTGQTADIAGFAPLDFKKTAAPAVQASEPPAPQASTPQAITPAPPAAAASTGYVRPGSQVDIKI